MVPKMHMKKLGIEEGKIELRKIVRQQWYSSIVLVIHCVTSESEFMDSKLIEFKLWNGTHTNHVSFERTNNKEKLGTPLFNDVNNVESRHEVLECTHAIDSFLVVSETKKFKDYSLSLTVEGVRLFVAVEKVSWKINESLLVMVLPKVKLVARK